MDEFVKEIARLTVNHDVDSDGNAVVYADELGKALEKVDPKWWRLED